MVASARREDPLNSLWPMALRAQFLATVMLGEPERAARRPMLPATLITANLVMIE